MKWTKTVPTKPGIYWHRSSDIGTHIVDINYDIVGENLHWFDELTFQYYFLCVMDEDDEFSDEPIAFPEEQSYETLRLHLQIRTRC